MAQKTLTKTGTFGVIGQVRIRSLLARSLRADRAAHAYLLVGPRGVGKAAIALEYARLLLCSGDEERPCAKCEECRLSQTLQHPDLHLVFPLPPAKRKGQSDDDNGDDAESLAGGIAEITKTLARDPYAPIIVEHQSSGSREATRSKGEPTIRIGQVRSLLHLAMLKPFQAARKVFVILHADTMNPNAQNAFLKVLEEPPEAAFFVLTTDREQALRPTVRSRCQRLAVPPLDSEEIAAALTQSGSDAARSQISAAISGGSLAHARALAEGDVGRIQEHVINYLKAAASCDPLKLPEASETLRDTGSLPPDTSLELLKMLFRDVALRRLGETPLTFRESEKVLDGILKAFPQADIDAAVQIVDECMNHLARGYTENFSLFTLAIRLRDCLGPRTAVKRATSRTVDV